MRVHLREIGRRAHDEPKGNPHHRSGGLGLLHSGSWYPGRGDHLLADLLGLLVARAPGIKAVTDGNGDDMVTGAVSSDPLGEASVWHLEEHALTVSRFCGDDRHGIRARWARHQTISNKLRSQEGLRRTCVYPSNLTPASGQGRGSWW
jgi:hypothetical protein